MVSLGGSRGGPTNQGLHHFCCSGRPWGTKWPQDLPKELPRPPTPRFFMILGFLWKNFCIFFGRCIVDVCCLVACLVGWLVGWLAGWLVACLLACLRACLLGWLLAWFVDFLVGWCVGWLVRWLTGWLVGWLVDCFFVSRARWRGWPARQLDNDLELQGFTSLVHPVVLHIMC